MMPGSARYLVIGSLGLTGSCSVSRLRKPYLDMPKLHWFANLGQPENRTQDAQKGQTSHPPNPGGYFTRPP
jgi:hypothetical protein